MPCRYTLEFAQGNIIPSVNSPMSAPEVTPENAIVNGNIPPRFSTTRTSAVDTTPMITTIILRILLTCNCVISLRTNLETKSWYIVPESEFICADSVLKIMQK